MVLPDALREMSQTCNRSQGQELSLAQGSGITVLLNAGQEPGQTTEVMTASTTNMDLSAMADTGESLRRECERLRRQVDAQALRLQTQSEELGALKARFLRYETALRGSQITVSTQDRDLRYTSASNSICGHSAEDVLGCTDEQIFPAPTGAAVAALKREALQRGEQRRCEVAIEDFPGTRCYDLHIEPLRNDAGDTVGLTCAAVDVTDRKEGEAHLRMLLRELTHRSKNLLAVIQAMARQTARHAGSVDWFLEQFGARLQALAASHDLLVRESWHGASLHELVRSQLAGYLDRAGARIAFTGPDVALRPEAAQNLGLALHELAANAARHGALSVPEGRVVLSWERTGGEDGGGLAIEWREENGPPVKARRKKGFGSMVIERNLALALGAEVALDFAPEGLRCRMVIPSSQMLPPR
jgi:PAS domain S-box-containing protein